MAVAAANRSRTTAGQTAHVLRLVMVWHTMVGVGGVAALYAIVIEGLLPIAPLLRWGAIVLLAIVTLSSGAAVALIMRRSHKGRVLSLFVNYIGFLACVVAILQLLGAFEGIDTLASRLDRGVPFLLVAVAGYLIGAMGDRFAERSQVQRNIQRASRVVILLGLALALLAIISFSALPGWLSGLLDLQLAGLVAAALLFALAFWAMWRAPTAWAMQTNNARQEMLEGLLFLSPNLIGFLLFLATPLLLSLYTSFTDWDAFGTRNWIGLDNYAKLLNLTLAQLDAPGQRAAEVIDVRVYDELARVTLLGQSWLIGATDKLFWIALRNTVVFCLLAVPGSAIPALFVASVLNSKLPGMRIFRAVYFLPSIAAVVGVSLIWQWMYNAAVGWINYFILLVTNFVNMLAGLELEAVQPRWLSSSDTALLAIIIMVAWQTMGFNTILYLAGMQSIPKVLYEAATVDGANAWRQFRHVTLPLLAPTTVFVVATTTIQAFQVFEPVFIMTNPPGGPNNATLTAVLYLYQNGFQRFRQGYASAVAWILFLLIFAVTLIQFRRQRGVDYER